MKIYQKATIILTIAIVMIGLSINFTGCSKDPSPLFPNQQETNLLNKRTTDQITFLKSKTPKLAKKVAVSQVVTANEGGLVRIGDYETGTSGVKFLPGDLQEDTTINICWDSENFQAEFSPHGIVFNRPVTIRLSYKDANLCDLNEDRLRIWYYDELNNLWEIVGNEVN